MQKIKTALLSFGMSGKVFHAPFLEAHSGFTIGGAWERSKEEIAKQYPDAKRYTSLEAILNDPSIELIIVNTPTYTHYDYAKHSLLAGKHVVVEKAFTTTVAEAEELKSISEKQNKKLAVFQNRRWDSDFKTVQQVINDGKLGELVEVTFSFDRFNPLLSPKQHKETPGPGAGVVNDLGPHLIDQALVLFGMPEAVFADIAITRKHSRVDDYFEILLYYPQHRVRLKAGYFVKENGPAYIVHARNGSFIKSRSDRQESRLLAGEKPTLADWGVEPETEQGILNYLKAGETVREKIPTLAGNYLSFYEGIHRSIVQNEATPVTAQDGLNVMKIIEAALRSSEDKTIIDL
ncbi:oxidoreductase [Chryseotalea sanaruensis]|uniref:Oxidoreductase n=1 Tax=Chryseotalea sanaruensis TaxID=2482724 RepID=A0A401U5N2_9BACT|nr:Gfo/Idh/MocA family oxidoreductase [Chryseotalea sanaruensis]GCC50096.1 oxidoreductase [Chryseotalea sanaruensis]